MSDKRWKAYPSGRRAFLASLIALAGGAALSGCDSGQATATGSKSSTGSSNGTVALIVGSKTDPFYITMERGARSRAAELGIRLITDGPASFDPTLQIPLVQAAIAQKVQVLIIAACEKNQLIEPLRRADQAGIKVISVDTYIGDGNYTNGPVTFPLSYIGSDNLQGGEIAAMALIKSIGGAGKIYIQNTSPGASTTDLRVQGCKKVIAASQGAITLAGIDYNYHDIAKASTETLAMLQRNPDIAGIFGTNVGGGEGAAQGVKLANLQGTVKVASYDAPEKSVTDLRNGVVDLLIAQKPAEMGSTALDYAYSVLQGDTSTIKKRVPTGFVIIDRNNIDTPQAQAAIYTSA